jgi:hypothetical protein
VLSGKFKIFVGDFAFGDDVGGAGEEEVGNPGTVALHIDDQLTAGHIDFYAVAADLALQGQNGDQRTGSGSAGVSEVFYAAFLAARAAHVDFRNALVFAAECVDSGEEETSMQRMRERLAAMIMQK